jgi:hypothetical protein
LNVPLTEESWRKAYRIVSSQFPPIGIFDRVADPADLEAVYYVESLTNPRLREEAGELALVATGDRVSGPGTTAIMAAFTHLNPSGSRFTNGEYGVYYAASTQKTAIAETVFHVERFAEESCDPPTSFVMRVYVGRLNKRPYHDLRGRRRAYGAIFDPDPANYGPAQRLGAELRDAASWGILYRSVRDPDGKCAAVFRPPALGVVHQAAHLAYCWDGTKITDVLELRSLGRPA